MTPRISVLFPAMRGYDAAQVALETWESQTARAEIEILVLCPDRLLPPPDTCRSLPPGQVIVPIGEASLHHARAIGVARATGDYLMFAEDHCVPDPGWTRAVIDRLDQGWDGVGPVLRPGNRSSRWADASFLVGYGEWMMPVRGGPTSVLCGLNVTLRGDLVRPRAPTLADELLIGSLLVQQLGRSGAKFYLEEAATMTHFDPATASFAISSLAALGLGFGALRTRRWPWLPRMLYPLGFPLVATLHARRAVRHYLRAGRGCGLSAAAPLLALFLAVAWAVGEAVGAVAGVAAVERLVSWAEIRPLTRHELARAAAHAAPGRPHAHQRRDRNRR